jgi:acyl carrier protein
LSDERQGQENGAASGAFAVEKGYSRMIEEIRSILKEHGRLSTDATTIGEDADLYQAGLTSHASVNVMLALEGKFDIEFPDRMLKRGVFESINAMRAALEELIQP